MSWQIYLLFAVVLALVLVVLYLLQKQKEDLERFKKDILESQSFELMNQRLEGLQTRLDGMTNVLGQRLDGVASLFGKMNKEIGRLQDVSTSIKDLQEFLKSPKLRGNVGEQILRDLLEEVLPKSAFRFQHKFKEGQVVDAVIKTSKGLIPIDSKFPMEVFRAYFKAENPKEKEQAHRIFRRALKKHISEIAKKYILTREGTLNFAVMYIPSESVYYQVVSQDQDLIEYGHKSRVFLVSPNSFYYFLKLVLTGLETHKIDKIAQSIMAVFEEVKVDSEKLGQQLSVLARHIRNAYVSVSAVEKQHEKIDDKLKQAKQKDIL
ncbi:DNA recombination protein RmuC [bacterium]|nr:DNA recombination protein RmuC [bacterium]